jgi:hypothetical protein
MSKNLNKKVLFVISLTTFLVVSIFLHSIKMSLDREEMDNYDTYNLILNKKSNIIQIFYNSGWVDFLLRIKLYVS